MVQKKTNKNKMRVDFVLRIAASPKVISTGTKLSFSHCKTLIVSTGALQTWLYLPVWANQIEACQFKKVFFFFFVQYALGGPWVYWAWDLGFFWIPSLTYEQHWCWFLWLPCPVIINRIYYAWIFYVINWNRVDNGCFWCNYSGFNMPT